MTSLRQRMLEDMQVRWLSPSTQERYVQAVARFARHFGRSPAHLGPEQIRTYQVYLTTERRLAASSLVVAVSALRFLYRVTLKKDWTLDDVIPLAKRRAARSTNAAVQGRLLAVGLPGEPLIMTSRRRAGPRRPPSRPTVTCHNTMLVILTETGLGSTARCCGRRRHRQANSVRVCSPTSRRVASLRPRSAGLTALTSAPRTARPHWLLPTMPTHTPPTCCGRRPVQNDALSSDR